MIKRNIAAILTHNADMTSEQSNTSNTVAVYGIAFETVMPERILQIPSKRPAAKTQVQFGIRITNNTDVIHI